MMGACEVAHELWAKKDGLQITKGNCQEKLWGGGDTIHLPAIFSHEEFGVWFVQEILVIL